MTDINSVTIVGRLTRDLNGSDQREYAFTPNGQARANISIAVNRSRKQGDQWVDEANFFNVTIWGKTAENLLPYLKKGKQICVEEISLIDPLITLLAAAVDCNAYVRTRLPVWCERIFTLVTSI